MVCEKKLTNITPDQGWGAGAEAGWSRVFLAPWGRSRLKKKPGAGAAWKKNQEPEPLKNQPALQPSAKIKSIGKLYFSYSSLGKIFRFMVKKTIILLVLYFFAVLPYQFAGKRIFCQGAGAGRSRVFLALWSRSRSRSKKNTRSRSRSRLGKKPGAGAGTA